MIPKEKNMLKRELSISLQHNHGAQRRRDRLKKCGDYASRMRHRLVHSEAFKRLIDWSYGVCDDNKTGHIGQAELYAGLLLVHVKLAKYVGPAACFPPSRRVVNDLFDASDVDSSGGISREEFNIIVNVSCAQILFRILVNYATMVFVIPFIAQRVVDRWGIREGSYMEIVCEQLTGLFLFLLFIPLLWNWIDQEASQSAGREAARHRSCYKSENKIIKKKGD